MPEKNKCLENHPLPGGSILQIDEWRLFALCLDDEHMTVFADKLEMETGV